MAAPILREAGTVKLSPETRALLDKFGEALRAAPVGTPVTMPAELNARMVREIDDQLGISERIQEIRRQEGRARGIIFPRCYTPDVG